MSKRTALYERHQAAGGKMIDFAEFELPVQYKTGIIKEHNSVRQSAGLFDVSHMGEFLLTGSDALANLNQLLTNDFTGLEIGQVRYSPMCLPDGGTMDDFLVYKTDAHKYYIIPNAANREKDYQWIEKHLEGDVILEDQSDKISQLALQGPLSLDILKKVMAEKDIPKRYYRFAQGVDLAGVPCLVSRTGYTGEFGYEIYCKNEYVVAIWDALLEAGGESIMPCGLGARDTLRLEAGMPLYGHELSEDISPAECGLGFAIKTEKKHFIGKEALQKPLQRKRIGVQLMERGMMREDMRIFSGKDCIGRVTSGTMSPTLKKAIGMALVPADFSLEEVAVEVRRKMIPASVVQLPFYKAKQ